MHIPRHDRSIDETEWRTFVAGHAFGHLVAAGTRRDVPVVVPTQFLLDGNELLLHLAAPNPLFEALGEQPRVILSVAGDWAFIPSDWKAIGHEDPTLGIPTTYYAAVQLIGAATVEHEPAAVARVLRRQLAALQPEVPIADPELVHAARLRGIRAVTISVDEVRTKFKFGGNVDRDHRLAVIDRLRARGGVGDRAAADHTAERTAERPAG